MAAAGEGTMKAVVVHEAGGPEALKIEQVPIPKPGKGQALIRVKAFGLNRAEVKTREGHSAGVVKFPRILGIEAVGTIEDAPGGEFEKGQVVATAMGGMGRTFDGGYAQYTCVPASQVLKITSKIPWELLGALPEMMQTVHGSLVRALKLEKGDKLLIRGGTSSIGLAATTLAKHYGAYVAATSRRTDREQLVRASGADEFVLETGSIKEEVRKRYPDGFNKVLDLVGISTLEDSIKCVAYNGIACMAGILDDKWTFESFAPMISVPTGIYLTTYASSPDAVLKTPVDEFAKLVQDGTLKIPVKTFKFDQIAEAHKMMDESTANAKIVILVD